MRNGSKKRIGGKVFHMPDDIWRICKDNYVTASDIENEKNRFKMLGIEVSYSTAAAAFLRRKF